MSVRRRLLILVCWASSLSAHADGADEAMGLWATPEGDAVIRFAPCPELPGALCGTIVWDQDAGTHADTCGVRIAQLARPDKGAWRDGWVYDPRDGRKYQGVVRVKGEELRIRAFVGVEILGQTEQLRRVPKLPDTPQCPR